ncbi:MarR family transcriptional regulator [uncultured Albimonas sp.]|uniref:MarR family winged helix-turn-helix transcriptional regulator n=1 Tax=uncultured Albimonas sp. TaxID=1331701 RepID=UPI0030EE2406
MTRERQGTNVAFHDIARLRAQIYEHIMREDRLTLSQGWVLVNVVNKPGQTQKQVAERVLVGTVTTGGLIDRLEARGLVERRADPKDRRAKRIYPSPEAAALVEKMNPIIDQLDEISFAGLPEDTVDEIASALKVIRRNLREELSRRQSAET